MSSATSRCHSAFVWFFLAKSRPLRFSASALVLFQLGLGFGDRRFAGLALLFGDLRQSICLMYLASSCSAFAVSACR